VSPECLGQLDHERRLRRTVRRAAPAHADRVRLDGADLPGEGLVADRNRPACRRLLKSKDLPQNRAIRLLEPFLDFAPIFLGLFESRFAFDCETPAESNAKSFFRL